MQVSVDGSTITVDGAEDEVVIVFRKTSTVAVLGIESDDEVDTVTVLTNVVGKYSTPDADGNIPTGPGAHDWRPPDK